MEFISYKKPFAANREKILIIIDGYKEPLSLPVLKVLDENNIVVNALPSQNSGKTQPFDLVGFSSLRHKQKTAAKDCVLLHNEKPLDMFDFCSLL